MMIDSNKDVSDRKATTIEDVDDVEDYPGDEKLKDEDGTASFNSISSPHQERNLSVLHGIQEEDEDSHDNLNHSATQFDLENRDDDEDITHTSDGDGIIYDDEEEDYTQDEVLDLYHICEDALIDQKALATNMHEDDKSGSDYDASYDEDNDDEMMNSGGKNELSRESSFMINKKGKVVSIDDGNIIDDSDVGSEQDEDIANSDMNLSNNEEETDIWSKVRRWFSVYPGDQERKEACAYLGSYGCNVSHLICQLNNPPRDVVCLVIHSCPKSLRVADNTEVAYYPLHYAVRSTTMSYDVLKTVVEGCKSVKTKIDAKNRTPLHLLLQNAGMSRDVDRITTLLCNGCAAASMQDSNGFLPIHIACAFGTSNAVLSTLHIAEPDGINVCEKLGGKTPLHLALVNSNNADIEIAVSFLVNAAAADGHNIVDARDSADHLPLYNMGTACQRWGKESSTKNNLIKEKRVLEARSQAHRCLNIFLSAKPRGSSDFLRSLRRLPEWLKDTAVLHPHVQGILNNKISQRLPTFFLMADLIMLALLIVSLWQYSNDGVTSSSSQGPPSWPKNAMLASGGYFLFREFVHFTSIVGLGQDISEYFRGFSTLIDLSVIFISFLFSLYLPASDKSSYRSCAAISQIILWIAVFSFIRSIVVEFAVYLGVLVQISRKIASGFFINLLIALLSFSIMFWIIFYETKRCDENLPCSWNPSNEDDYVDCLDITAHCTLGFSLLKSFSMMLGEIDNVLRYNAIDGDIDNQIFAQFIYIVYAVVVVLLLSNVLIAIVSDTYMGIDSEQADILFWKDRLNDVSEFDSIYSILFQFSKSLDDDNTRVMNGESDDAKDHNCQIEEKVSKRAPSSKLIVRDNARQSSVLRRSWSYLTAFFDNSSYEDIQKSALNPEYWCFVLVKMLAALIMIIWIVLGLFFGILWPPQVREFILVEKCTKLKGPDGANVAACISNKLGTLDDHLKEARCAHTIDISKDRSEIDTLQNDINELKSELSQDLSQVKELMLTLLKMQTGQN